jgi:hypothetical protein
MNREILVPQGNENHHAVSQKMNCAKDALKRNTHKAHSNAGELKKAQ